MGQRDNDKKILWHTRPCYRLGAFWECHQRVFEYVFRAIVSRDPDICHLFSVRRMP